MILNDESKPSLEYVLEHHGVKGMKWGVRKAQKAQNQADRAKRLADRHPSRNNKRRAARTQKEADRRARRQDKKWEKDAAKNKTYFKIYNDGADRINREIDSFNNRPEYKGKDFTKDSPDTQKYYKDYSAFATKHFQAAADAHGTNFSGTKKIKFTFDIDTDFMPQAQIVSVDAKHADGDPPIAKVKVSYDAKGKITSIEILPKDEMTQGEMAVDNVLMHFGTTTLRRP